MGTFLGHALPGTFFLAFGIWWTVQITRRCVACRMFNLPFYSSATYPCFFLCACAGSVEGVVKVVATGAGMAGELFASTEPLRTGQVGQSGNLAGLYVGDLEHVSMYLFFCLSGVVDILLARPDTVLPPGLDYIIAAAAFVAEFVLFKFHGHWQPMLEMALHTLLLYAIAGSAVAVLIEYKYPRNILCAYTRAFMVLLQGTWFFQVGFILYPPFVFLHHWDQSSMDNIMLVTAVFTWHMAGVLLLLLAVAAVTYCCTAYSFPVREGTRHHTHLVSLHYKQLPSYTCESEGEEEHTV